ncbi:MAG: DUF3619 family protein [Candidatus Dactylopiibacterium sp.]|nr:DUF3619 family protein [Candidatus Dactylopiibacterium sp.]
MNIAVEPTAAEERTLGLFVRNQLNAGNPMLAPRVTERLFAARQAALARHVAPTVALSAAGIGHIGRGWFESGLRPALFTGALIVALMAGTHLMSIQHIESQEDIDTALLSDTLPLTAYLDSGFQTWLADSAQQQH